jgi:putative oxidoreductase
MDNQLLAAEKVLNITGRVLLGLYFVVPGLSKIAGFESMSEYMAAHNVPLIPLLLVITIILQVAGGASLLLGYRTQLCAFLLAGLTLLISLFMHNFWSYEEGLERAHEMQNFIKNLAIMAGLLFVSGTRPATAPA